MSLYRNIVWFTKGMLDYTRSGYLSSSKSFNGSDLEVDCSGQSYMVTGSNSGIGKALVLALAKRGGTVHMVCRNREKAQAARDEVAEETGNQNIHVHIVDLSEPREVYRFAKDFASGPHSLHVLVNNAGCMINEREVNSENLEKNFATNTLSVHILTNTLIPVLSKSVEPRVVTVSSGGMLVQKLDLTDLQFEKAIPFDGTMAYAQTKRQQVVLMERYAERYPGIHFSSVNPGWVDTPGVRVSMSYFHRKMEHHLRTPAQGADTVLWLAISHQALKYPCGLFYLDRKPSAIHLPLAWTRSTLEEDNQFLAILDDFLEKFRH